MPQDSSRFRSPSPQERRHIPPGKRPRRAATPSLWQELDTPAVAAANDRNDRPPYGRDMAGNTREGVELQHRKRFTTKLFVLGFAVAAVAAPSAQARPDPGDGKKIVSSRDRPSPIRRVATAKANFYFGSLYHAHCGEGA